MAIDYCWFCFKQDLPNPFLGQREATNGTEKIFTGITHGEFIPTKKKYHDFVEKKSFIETDMNVRSHQKHENYLDMGEFPASGPWYGTAGQGCLIGFQ